MKYKKCYCKDCKKILGKYAFIKGSIRCHSCATSVVWQTNKRNQFGKNNSNWKGGKFSKQYFCISSF